MDMSLVFISLACLVTGFSKFSIGGMGLIILPLTMLAFPGPEALGVIIPLYLLTDFIAVLTYRKNVNWRVLAKLLPFGALGVIGGTYVLGNIDPHTFMTILGILIFTLLGMSIWLDYHPLPVFTNRYAASVAGALCGFVGVLANAAGPLMGLFLLEQKMDKSAYVATRVWAFLTLNIMKLVGLVSLGLINTETLQASASGLPALFIGMFIGYKVFARISAEQLKLIVRGAISLSAAHMLFFKSSN
ncbi:sulfite exporter TauE/SafE family protein [Grimontia kaedaensis]|uniref:Probable membrane transporter protein n=1 Tax=Grimontia kaedaensis TaxID=2872157 RepID=A0ABY4WPD7_9GAMM|nr:MULTISPECIES: sulfite exporter TauE/SafE family protein [Grimontia]USH01457.1 sulfite exporter TauE/SafE family protein [Grimontia kaedaensis]WRV98772.1 sulfite exporter TauE/SafE family protein [Grimontia sp. NTOU-MAR1]